MKYFCFFILIVIVAVVFTKQYSEYRKSKITDYFVTEGKKYSKKIIPTMTKWEMDSFRSYYKDNMRSPQYDNVFRKQIERFSKIGNLIKNEEPRYTNYYKSWNGNYVATFLVNASFENGDGQINIQLVHDGIDLKVLSFSVDSELTKRIYDCSKTEFSDFRFIGKVIQHVDNIRDGEALTPESATTFDILEWKTFNVSKSIEVRGVWNSQCACRYNFEVGKTYLVNGEYMRGRAVTFYCSGIKEFTDYESNIGERF